MITLSLHVYYNNNSLSSAWPISLEAVPRIGEKVEYKIPSGGEKDQVWVVVDVVYYPVSSEFPESSEYSCPWIAIFCRPEWAVETSD